MPRFSSRLSPHLSGKPAVQVVMVCMAVLSPVWVWAQSQKSPTAEEIVARMGVRNAERQAALEHYASERTYRVEYKGTGGKHSAEILVHAEYRAPDQKRFVVISQSGSKFICEKVLRRLLEGEQEAMQKMNRMQTTLSPENYDVELVGEEQIDGARAWVLKVQPKVANKFTYRGRVWVNMQDYAMMRVMGEPAKNPSWWISRASFESRYARRGEFWLPARNVSTSHVRIGGEATLTIDYGTYEALVGRVVRGGTEQAGVAGAKTASELAAGKATQDHVQP
jgi:outer membrane lipoprotein-sorting protein